MIQVLSKYLRKERKDAKINSPKDILGEDQHTQSIIMKETTSSAIRILNVLIGVMANLKIESLLIKREEYGQNIFGGLKDTLNTAMNECNISVLACWTRLLFTFLYRIKTLPFTGCTLKCLYDIISENLKIDSNAGKLDLYELRLNTLKLIGGLLLCAPSAEIGNESSNVPFILLKVKALLDSMSNIDIDPRLRSLAQEILTSSFPC